MGDGNLFPGATTGVITALEPGGNLTTPQKVQYYSNNFELQSQEWSGRNASHDHGMSLKQTSSVTIGKAKAPFTVNSDMQVTATVGAGAVTGKVTLKTPGGTATGPGIFTVQ